MPRKESSVLGIDLHEQEIRVVQLNYRANKPTLGKIGRAPMPEGAVLNGRILHTGPVAVALRLLLNSMGIGTTARVVTGVLGDGTALRTMSVPPVPEHELPGIIAGEVNHYALVHTAGGAYSYLRLQPHYRQSGEQKGPDIGDKRETWLDPEAGGHENPSVVTVFAVEEDVLFSLRDTIEQANLTVESVEPTQYAMFRSIMVTAGQGATLFAMMISPANTDVAFVNKGVIVGYRRIDIGSRLLTLEYTTASGSAGAPVPTSLDPSLFGRPAAQPGKASSGDSGLNRLAIESLSLEVQRTLNYYQREFPDANIEDHVYLAVDDVKVEGIAKELTLSLGVQIEPFKPTVGAHDEKDSGSGASALSPIYAAALGLAHQGQQVMSRVPRIDLFTKQRIGVQQAETRRNFSGSIIISALAILLAGSLYFMFHKQISGLDAEISATDATTANLKNQTSATLEDRHKQQEQYTALRAEGVPLAEIIDGIASSVKPGTGLQAVVITPDLSITVTGQSVNEKLMIDTIQSLQKCPVLTDMRIVRFGQLPTEQGVGVGFEMDGKAVSEGRIRQSEAQQK